MGFSLDTCVRICIQYNMSIVQIYVTDLKSCGHSVHSFVEGRFCTLVRRGQLQLETQFTLTELTLFFLLASSIYFGVCRTTSD